MLSAAKIVDLGSDSHISANELCNILSVLAGPLVPSLAIALLVWLPRFVRWSDLGNIFSYFVTLDYIHRISLLVITV